MRKKLICLSLAVSMLAGCLWGCSSPARTETSGNAGEQRAEKEKDEDGPKGRYVEGGIGISLEEGERAVDIIQTEDQTLELYTIKDKKASRYIWTGGIWEKQDKSLLESLEFPDDFFDIHMIYGEDKNRYVMYPGGDDYKMYLMKLTEGQEPQMLLDEVFSVKNDRGYYDVRPDFAAVSADGNIFLSNRRMTDVYTPEGGLVLSLPQEGSSMEWKTSGLLVGGRYITNGSNSYLCYNTSSMSAASGEEIPYQTAGTDIYAPMASDGNGGMYIVNSQGIHHISKGGDLWETVCDGGLNSLSLPSVSLKKLFAGNENDFFVWMSHDETVELKHYTYDPEMPSVPGQNLTVYGLDLETSDTIRQAASMFQLDHPDVRVELIDGKAAAGSTTVSDTIRTLNTELLGGNGADLLVLDGLPVDSYIEKGILEDMSGLLGAMTASGDLMEQVSKPYTKEDGSIYQIPTRIILLSAYGDIQAINSLSSMEAMRAYQNDPSHLPLRPKTTYENLMRQLLTLSYDEIVDPGTGQPEPGKIKELLETVKLLGEAGGAKNTFEESEDGGMGYIYNRPKGTEGLTESEFDRVDRNMSAIAIDKISGMYDVLMPLAVQKKNGFTMETVKDSYLPAGTLGINRAGRNKDLAKEFVLYVLGQEVQSSDLSDGLPVNTRAVRDWVDRESAGEVSVMAGGSDDYMLSGDWPEKEERQMIFDTLAKTEHPIRMDRVLVEIIIDETKGYFDGSLSLEQAAQNAQNKTMLYFSE